MCNVCRPLTCPSGQHSGDLCSFPAGCKLAVQDIVTTFGDADRHDFCDSTLLASLQAFPAVEQLFAVEPCQTSSMADCCLTQLNPGIDRVESSKVSDVKGHSFSSRHGHNCCFPLKVGGIMESQGCLWLLVSSSVQGPPQSPRVACSFPSPAAFLASSGRLSCPHAIHLNNQDRTKSLKSLHLTHKILTWSLPRLGSLRSVHLPGSSNQIVDALPRDLPHPGEWRLQ